ncbi:DUF4105 domain-containing protein [Myroides albus]|uniref:DUF4105 domain-containing protein n=1 Tax=Myroides albus TaxID=2562892 RepID=UPI00215964B3|nr:DUF4105 domain-containing protein [Myroides albus]UVD80417.1 DUF4105 domain-containing protein [Myroides albus]
MGKKIMCVLLCLWFGQIALSAERALSDRAQISVLTIGTGPMLHELYGHTAIRVFDPSYGIDRVYNFGMFDFSTPSFGLRFIKGDMLYYADYTSMKDFVRSYVYYNRSVYEQVLNLTEDQKEKIWHSLENALTEENKYYVYKFIDQNCTTKVVDIVNQDTNTVVEAEVTDNIKTYRQMFNDYLDSSYFLKLGINMILGARIDQTNDKQFLPDKYMMGLEQTKMDGKPIVKETKTIFEANQELRATTPWWDTYAFFSLLCVVLAVMSYKVKAIRYSLILIIGLFGAFFLFVNFYSFHVEVLNNNILLLCNPLLLLLPFVNTNIRMGRVLHIVLLIGMTIYVVLNITSEKLVVTLPLYLLTLCLLIIDRIIINKKD